MAKIFSGARFSASGLWLLLLFCVLSGCSWLKTRDSMLKDCEATQAKLRAEIKDKDARLQKFNQIYPDGRLKGSLKEN